MPSALLRSAPSVKVVVTIESAAGETIAAPRPCTPRATISQPDEVAKPPASEATEKTIEADDEDAPAAEQVRRAAAEQQEAAEHERVRVDDPLQAALGEAEVALDRRQRDVHDRGVEHDHELRDREHRERLPAARIERRLRWLRRWLA